MGDLDKLIVAKDFKKLPKVQQIAQSGHTDVDAQKSFCVQEEEREIMCIWVCVCVCVCVCGCV